MSKAAPSEPQEYIRVPCPGELTHQPYPSLPLHTGALKWDQSLAGSIDGVLVLSPQRPEEEAVGSNVTVANLSFRNRGLRG